MAVPTFFTYSSIKTQLLFSIILIYVGVLLFNDNILYIQSIGSGIGINSESIHVTFISVSVFPFITIPDILLISAPTTKLITSSKTKLISASKTKLIAASKTKLICAPASIKVESINSKKGISILNISTLYKGKCLQFHIVNKKLLESKLVLKFIFKLLMSNEQFINFGFKKVIIITAILNEGEFSYHSNVLINNKTKFNTYYNLVRDNISTLYDHGYSIDAIQFFKVRVFNMDNLQNKHIKISKDGIKVLGNRNYSTQITKSLIKPLNAPKSIKPSNFNTMDIETIGINNVQIPIAISHHNGVKNKTELFLINHLLLQTNLEKTLKNLWSSYFDYLIKLNVKTIFVHNLGTFDGYFLYKAMLNHFTPSSVSCIIDSNNSFISITLRVSEKYSITFKDSLRVFPVSLSELCKIFGVEGKISKYNPLFNSIDLFNNNTLLNEFISYAKQDAFSLYNALLLAQKFYIETYKIDITTIFSTSTLSFKIFRTHYLKESLPILSKSIDSFIRKGYFGGGTDYYNAHATNLKYYDVNSLYPFAMCKPMPFQLIKHYKDMIGIELNNFFGFCLAEIICPSNMERPVLPVKLNGKTIYPTGIWKGVYFSEELKAVEKLGYKIRLIEGYEFSKIDLFSNFVNEFYKIKQNSIGSKRFIAKLHLNTLYGYFGRKLDLLETMTVKNKDLNHYLGSMTIKNIHEINEEYSTIIVSNNTNLELISELDNLIITDIESNENRNIKANVAIAAAVTSYARIHMIDYKLLPGTVYTDTD